MPSLVPRHVKEAVAAVSRTNACPYCVEAHDLLYLASGGKRSSILDMNHSHTFADPRTRAVVEWALATHTP